MSLFSIFPTEDILGRPSRHDSGGIEQDPAVAKREVFIAIRRDGIIGDGTSESPYNGANLVELDRILSGFYDDTINSPVRFVFGPGIFRTRGGWQNSAVPGTWIGVTSGQEFVGAGMFATILRLEIPAPLENGSYGVFGVAGNRADNVVIKDMTIDCDMQNQRPTPRSNYPRIMVLGIGLLGDNIRVKRVRVINAGSRTPGFDYDYKAPRGENNGAECFPLFLTSHATPETGFPKINQRNSFIEDCIVERPYHSNGRETTCIHIGGGGFNDHCGIRNCLVDCAIVPEGPFPKVPVQSLIFTATEGTLETLTQHDLNVGDKVIISGAGAPYDGQHLVTSIPPDPHFPGALHQWKAILAPGPAPGTATGAVLAEKRSKPALLCTLSYSGTEVTVTTRVPHNREEGDWIFISGAVGDIPGQEKKYNGTFQVKGTPGTLTLKYELLVNPGTATGEIWLDRFITGQRHLDEVVEQNDDEVHYRTSEVNGRPPLYVKPGQYLRINGMLTYKARPDVYNNPYNGLFPVLEVVDRGFEVKVRINYADLMSADMLWDDIYFSDELEFNQKVVVNNVDYNNPQLNYCYTGAGFQAMGAFSHRQGCYERNRALNVDVGVYGDTGSDYDLTIRKNVFRNVRAGVFFPVNLIPIKLIPLDGTSSLVSGADYQISNSTDHHLEVGDNVLVTQGANQFFGEVKSRTATTFVITNPLMVTGAVKFLWTNQRRAYRIEKNLMDLSVPFVGTGAFGIPGASQGVTLTATSAVNSAPYAYLFGKMEIVENYIRFLNGQADYVVPEDAFSGISAYSTKSLLVRGNVIDFQETKTQRMIAWGLLGTEITLNNHTSEGKLIELYNKNTGHRTQGLEQMVETTWLTL